MPFRECCVFNAQRMGAQERAELGCLVLAMRLRIRYLKSEVIQFWVPDAGPSVELLAEGHAMKLRLLADGGRKPPFRRSRLTRAALEEWDRYWFEQFVPRYRRELHGQPSCRVVTYSPEREEVTHQLSPVDYLLRLEAQCEASGRPVTLMCCEPAGEECHRHILLADVLALQSISSALTRADTVRVKVSARGELIEGVRVDLAQARVVLDALPYARPGNRCLYATEVGNVEQVRALLMQPGVECVECMPVLLLSAL
jgi:hypothetical protein